MINPTVENILDFEGNIERSLASILNSLGFDAYPSDDDRELPVPRVEVIATTTEAGPHEAVLASGGFAGKNVYDQQNLRVTLKYYFAPEHARDYAGAVGKFRGAVRRLVFYSDKIVSEIDSQQLYHAAHASIRERSSIREVEAEENCWSLEMSIDMVVFLALETGVNAVVVAESGESDVNGYYILSGEKNGKPRYRSETHEISWSSSAWSITEKGKSGVIYTSQGDTGFPWDDEWLLASHPGSGEMPLPMVSQASIRDLLGFAPPPEWY